MSGLSRAEQALKMIQGLQSLFVRGLEEVSDGEVRFAKARWMRDGGSHGGGERFFVAGEEGFNRASVNFSHIYYPDLPEKKLASATALSAIIHPSNPHAPSLHMHISWTEMKSGDGYWRIMADLNPSLEKEEDTEQFRKCLTKEAPDHWESAFEQGKRYFYIPALERTRGVVHFYLEGHHSDDEDVDRKLAHGVGCSVIEAYLGLLRKRMNSKVLPEDREKQMAYHTLYFFQVLTLDRGTTSGLLVHDQNDLGIMGSLPAKVDKKLLASWRSKMPEPQDELLDNLMQVLPESGVVSDDVRLLLAQTVRDHYTKHPSALALQARGTIVPPTVENHR